MPVQPPRWSKIIHTREAASQYNVSLLVHTHAPPPLGLFGRLPLELRERIFYNLLPWYLDNTVRIRWRSTYVCNSLALRAILLVSRSFYHEIAFLCYRHYTLVFDVATAGPDASRVWLQLRDEDLHHGGCAELARQLPERIYDLIPRVLQARGEWRWDPDDADMASFARQWRILQNLPHARFARIKICLEPLYCYRKYSSGIQGLISPPKPQMLHVALSQLERIGELLVDAHQKVQDEGHKLPQVVFELAEDKRDALLYRKLSVPGELTTENLDIGGFSWRIPGGRLGLVLAALEPVLNIMPVLVSMPPCENVEAADLSRALKRFAEDAGQNVAQTGASMIQRTQVLFAKLEHDSEFHRSAASFRAILQRDLDLVPGWKADELRFHRKMTWDREYTGARDRADIECVSRSIRRKILLEMLEKRERIFEGREGE